VTVPANGVTTVEFAHNIVEPGTYTARVGNETATVRVLAADGTPPSTATPATTSTTFPGFGTVVALVALVVAAFRARRL
jgi:PGF-CTERM protein